ncbi:MAG: 2-oxoacid:acceptor oxidoreductase subunit alpha [Rhodospirillales bacterium]|nr:2-oxoacid:acceptor oxidoreductase subunit alpha [Rhodospirillales bacterium]
MNIMTNNIKLPKQTRLCEDINVMVAGQGGDGSLTIIALLSHALRQRGLELYQTSNIASRIKGGHAAAILRASKTQHGGIGDNLDVLVAFDEEAIINAGPSMSPDGIVIYDISRGPLPEGCLGPDVLVLPVPFSRFAVRDLRRDLFKNGFGFGLVARVLGIEDSEAEDCMRKRFKKLSKAALEANLHALNLGFGIADEFGIKHGDNLIELADAEKSERLSISGNQATALGFLAAGGRFFAGYPITPATEIMDTLSRHASKIGCVVIQAEDELSAVNQAIGASLTGARAMTASSSPGIALMQESISHCGSAEIPLVIVNCQRAGPSTGMPTKTEQSDIGMMTQGGSGDFPCVVLYPGDANECFTIAALATNISQIAQCPVYIALDRSLAQNTATVAPFDLESVKLDKGKLLDEATLKTLDTYKRYAITDDGISPWALPGTPEGMNLVTGNERNEWGQVSTEPENRIAMMDKRARKINAIRDLLPGGVEHGDPRAEIGLLGTGMETGVMGEAWARLEEQGVKTRCHRPRTLSPVLDDTLDFINQCSRIYIIEHSESGQLERLLKGAGCPAEKLRGIRKYDGLPFSPGELTDLILTREAQG